MATKRTYYVTLIPNPCFGNEAQRTVTFTNVKAARSWARQQIQLNPGYSHATIDRGYEPFERVDWYIDRQSFVRTEVSKVV